MKKGKYVYVSLIVIIILLVVWLISNQKKAEVSGEDIQKVYFELVNQEKLEEGIVYTIKLINDSDFVIKQNNVYVWFPLKAGEMSFKGNEYKVEAGGNKLDIKPGEEVKLDVYMPFEGLGDLSLYGIESPHIKINGYLDQIDNEHRFSKGGSLIQE